MRVHISIFGWRLRTHELGKCVVLKEFMLSSKTNVKNIKTECPYRICDENKL